MDHETVSRKLFYMGLGWAAGCIGSTIYLGYSFHKDLQKIQQEADKHMVLVDKEAHERLKVIQTVFKELSDINGTVPRSEYERIVDEKFEFLHMLVQQPLTDWEEVSGNPRN